MSDTIIDQLTQSFLKFPGIGPRQAKRFVYYLLHAHNGKVDLLLKQIANLRQNILQCSECFRFFTRNSSTSLGASDTKICEICNDPDADQSLLMVVEKDIDLENIRKSGTYDGRYFVLGGLAPILDDHPENFIRLRELEKLIEHRVSDTSLGGETPKLQEIIIALSVNPEGDYTVDILKKILAPLATKHALKITLLGRGLSTGTELEYSDPETLKNAIKNRG